MNKKLQFALVVMGFWCAFCGLMYLEYKLFILNPWAALLCPVAFIVGTLLASPKKKELPHYVVTAYRAGQKDNHSYVVGCAHYLNDAIDMATYECDYRGGKYGVEVTNEKNQQVFYVQCSHVGMWGSGCDYV